jgi:DNA mismatch repair protein MSH4
MKHKLCDPENYAEVQELIKYCLNDDVGYSSKPTELRNQRVYAIRVRPCPTSQNNHN